MVLTNTFTELVSQSRIYFCFLLTISGRTARIGNEGLATSFYNDRDEPMADFLVKTLIECKQHVPDFLQSHLPENPNDIDFNDDSGAEEEENETANGNENGADAGWGGAVDADASAPAAADDAGWNPGADGAAAGGTW
jgi:ATP-dependent RNA helicase DDX3X